MTGSKNKIQRAIAPQDLHVAYSKSMDAWVLKCRLLTGDRSLVILECLDNKMTERWELWIIYDDPKAKSDLATSAISFGQAIKSAGSIMLADLSASIS